VTKLLLAKHLTFSAILAASALVACGSGGTSTGSDGGGGGGSGGSGTTTAADCTSGQVWTPAQGEGPNMRPGEACISCHSSEPEAPQFVVAGTVYPGIDEPNGCVGSGSTGAVVVVTDASGVEHKATVNSGGNFYLSGAALTQPIHVRVEANGQTSEMASAPPNGDCNSCHTAAGANGAPGRILMP
jgi:hypothetical protein